MIRRCGVRKRRWRCCDHARRCCVRSVRRWRLGRHCCWRRWNRGGYVRAFFRVFQLLRQVHATHHHTGHDKRNEQHDQHAGAATALIVRGLSWRLDVVCRLLGVRRSLLITTLTLRITTALRLPSSRSLRSARRCGVTTLRLVVPSAIARIDRRANRRSTRTRIRIECRRQGLRSRCPLLIDVGQRSANRSATSTRWLRFETSKRRIDLPWR